MLVAISYSSNRKLIHRTIQPYLFLLHIYRGFEKRCGGFAKENSTEFRQQGGIKAGNQDENGVEQRLRMRMGIPGRRGSQVPTLASLCHPRIRDSRFSLQKLLSQQNERTGEGSDGGRKCLRGRKKEVKKERRYMCLGFSGSMRGSRGSKQ